MIGITVSTELNPGHAPKVVLTGGPCGGKSTFLLELRSEDRDSRIWICIPEAVRLLFQSGLEPSEKKFQRAAVALQVAMECALSEFALAGQVLMCHRGTLDPLAYWLHRGWPEAEFYSLSGMSRQEHFSRYAAVIHIQTAAIGAEAHYTTWPYAPRRESPKEAVELDILCRRVWEGHPDYTSIDNAAADWKTKSARVRRALSLIPAVHVRTDMGGGAHHVPMGK